MNDLVYSERSLGSDFSQWKLRGFIDDFLIQAANERYCSFAAFLCF
ncbi:hypothetical protein [Geosporobacter ferrireducens]|nr:hypothetical protein [Geosporobacter ferrireducens]